MLQNKSLSLTTLCILALILSACGGGSSDNVAISGQVNTGSVAILLTDAPSDDFSEINLTITRIDLLAYNDAKTPLFTGEKNLDLLQLNAHSDFFSLTDNIPVGIYQKIRLTISSIELVKKDADGQLIKTIRPKLPGNGKLDLNPKTPFFITTDETLMLQIDVDAKNSIHIIQNGNGEYIFRPVIFVDIISDKIAGKVVNIHGIVKNLNPHEMSFEICKTDISFKDSSHYDDDSSFMACIKIQGNEDTSLFSSIPAHTPEWTDLNDGDPVTVIGHLTKSADNFHNLILNALAIEIGPAGTFARLSGTIKSPVDSSDQFDFEIGPGQGFVDGTIITVQLKEGTQILSRKGMMLNASDITLGLEAKISGILTLSDQQDDSLSATIVFLDTSLSMINNKLSGTLSDIDVDNNSFTLITLDIGDRCVRTHQYTDIFIITLDESSYSSDQASFIELMDGQTADVYGQYDYSGCFVADDIIAGTTAL